MSKTLLWIDDSMEFVMPMIQGVIVDSWKLGEKNEEGMRTRILIFGDGFLEGNTVDLWKQEDENKMNRDLFDLFIDECEDIQGPTFDSNIYTGNLPLIDKAIQILFKEEDKEEDHDFYNTVKSIWKKKLTEERESNEEKGSEEGNYKEAKKYVTDIIKRMQIDTDSEMAGKSKETIIGIDLALLSGDLDRAKDNKRIISMEFYHQLRMNQYPCFLYSTDADDKQLIDAWKNTYKRLYEDEEPVTTYERSDFSVKGKDNMILQIQKDLKINT